MITNIPKPEDFEKIGFSFMAQATEIILTSLNPFEHYLDLDKKLEEVNLKYLQPRIRTALLMTHQGVEALLKSMISIHSPLLLLDKRRDWPIEGKDRKFSECFSIGSIEVWKTFLACYGDSCCKELADFYNTNRLKRNEIVHGLFEEYIDPKELLIDILRLFTVYSGKKDTWWYQLRNYKFGGPIHEYYGAGYGLSRYHWVLTFLRNNYSRKQLNSVSEIFKKPQLYICPNCKNQSEDDEYDDKWAFLLGKNKASSKLQCFVCERKSDINRIVCTAKECDSNVSYQSNGLNTICLGCGEEHS